mmetsp:Transcript_27088/g.76078  ORF Transcript_27088/g.76078 Transcript_27088/m.76078 type:complete len:265 (-) Transcript_27088:85-879(-)
MWPRWTPIASRSRLPAMLSTSRSAQAAMRTALPSCRAARSTRPAAATTSRARTWCASWPSRRAPARGPTCGRPSRPTACRWCWRRTSWRPRRGQAPALATSSRRTLAVWATTGTGISPRPAPRVLPRRPLPRPSPRWLQQRQQHHQLQRRRPRRRPHPRRPLALGRLLAPAATRMTCLRSAPTALLSCRTRTRLCARPQRSTSLRRERRAAARTRRRPSRTPSLGRSPWPGARARPRLRVARVRRPRPWSSPTPSSTSWTSWRL